MFSRYSLPGSVFNQGYFFICEDTAVERFTCSVVVQVFAMQQTGAPFHENSSSKLLLMAG